MAYLDGIQAATLQHKMKLFMGAAIEMLCDNDEALDRCDAAEIDLQDGFLQVCMPAALSYYESTGRGTPWMDRLIESHIEAQGREWARQFPQRAPMRDCASEEGEHSQEAQEWESAATEGEAIYLHLQIEHKGADIELVIGFTDEINARIEHIWRESIPADEFLTKDDSDLETWLQRLCDAPYWSICTRQDGDTWSAWLGTQSGDVCYYDTSGHATEKQARERVQWGLGL